MTGSKKIDDGGYAFPASSSTFGINGMTLRDYFAGQCLGDTLGMIERAPVDQYKTMATKRGLKVENGVMAQLAAIMSYEIADAMIAARKADRDA